MEKPPKEKLIVRCMKAPLKALCKARDLYVKNMTKCANNINYCAYPSTLPRSFSVASSRPSEEDLREVMQMVMAQRSLRVKAADTTTTAAMPRPPVGPKPLPKSHSVAIGRIDEEKPSYFDEDSEKDKGRLFYPRSRSYAMTKSRSRMYRS